EATPSSCWADPPSKPRSGWLEAANPPYRPGGDPPPRHTVNKGIGFSTRRRPGASWPFLDRFHFRSFPLRRLHEVSRPAVSPWAETPGALSFWPPWEGPPSKVQTMRRAFLGLRELQEKTIR